MRARFIHGAVFAALTTTAFAWVGLGKTVVVEIDGVSQTVSTHAMTVSEVLQRAGVRVAAHDTLAPTPSSQIKDGSRIVIRRGRLVTVRVNDVERGVWVNASDVDQVLSEIGVDADDRTYVSASRSSRIPSSGEFSLQVRLPARVLLVVDGAEVALVTTAPTVAELLRSAGVELTANNTVTPALSAYPAEGTSVVVADRRGTRVARPRPMPFSTRRILSPVHVAGTVRVKTEGVPGVLVRYFRQRQVDVGRVVSTPDGQRIARAPRPRVVVVGTKKVAVATPKAAATPAATTAAKVAPKPVAKAPATPKPVTSTRNTTARQASTTTPKSAPTARTTTTTARTTTTTAAKTTSPAQTTATSTTSTANTSQAKPTAAPASDGLNWAALARCESGNNPRALSPGGTYRGLYQFHLQTWRGVGGKGDPIDASRDEQTRRAQILYRRVGAGAWGSCGSRLFRK